MTQATRFKMIRRWIGGSKKWVSSFLDSVKSNGAIVAVVVLGSVIRERSHRRSDFDLLVIYRGKRPVIKAPLEVDIRFVAADQIEEQILQGQEIVCWGLQFGAALYDPEHLWQRLQKTWAGRVPFPSPEEAHSRAEAALSRGVELLQLGDESAADDLLLSALTQLARERLIKSGVFPASRPELPTQLRELGKDHRLADLLDDAMYGESHVTELFERLSQLSELNV